MLKESLGGNSKTIMIAALSPAGLNHDETMSTLRFAQNVASIATKSKQNVDEEANVIKRMQNEILELKRKIKELKEAQARGEDKTEEIQ
jgi:hypothetical protein